MEPVSILPRQRNGRPSQPRRPTAARPPRRGAGGSLPRESRGARGMRPSDIVAESKIPSRPGSDRDAPRVAIRPRSRERKGRGRIQSERRFKSRSVYVQAACAGVEGVVGPASPSPILHKLRMRYFKAVKQLSRQQSSDSSREGNAFYTLAVGGTRSNMPYTYQGWTLYSRDVKLKKGPKVTIYFFSKRKPKSGKPMDEMPKNRKVGVNKRTGLPFLRKG